MSDLVGGFPRADIEALKKARCSCVVGSVNPVFLLRGKEVTQAELAEVYPVFEKWPWNDMSQVQCVHGKKPEGEPTMSEENKSPVAEICKEHGIETPEFPPYNLTKEMLDKAGKICLVTNNRSSLLKLISKLDAKMNDVTIHEHNLSELAKTQILALQLAKDCGLL